jgi:hypothetical protein
MLKPTPTPKPLLCGILALLAALLLLVIPSANAVGPQLDPIGTVTEGDPDNYDYDRPLGPPPAGQTGPATRPDAATMSASGVATGPSSRPAGSDRLKDPHSSLLLWWLRLLATIRH